jgi:hypothetical protein
MNELISLTPARFAFQVSQHTTYNFSQGGRGGPSQKQSKHYWQSREPVHPLVTFGIGGQQGNKLVFATWLIHSSLVISPTPKPASPPDLTQAFAQSSYEDTCQSKICSHLPGSSCEICSTSLSPRPERHYASEVINSGGKTINPKKLTITMCWSFGSVLARRTPSQMAWDDSNAKRRLYSKSQ